MGIKKINCEDIVRLPTFSHATIAGDFIFVSGILGTRFGEIQIVDGGVEKETEQILFHIETILKKCNAAIEDIVKLSVYLVDMDSFHDMNSAYLDAVQFEPPSRITVGVKELALGASVEMDCVAYKPGV